MNFDLPSRMGAHHARLSLHTIARAVAHAAMASGVLAIAMPAANAGTIYLPPCNGCSLTAGPISGDEWIVQGGSVAIVGSFGFAGTLTNQAQLLTNHDSLGINGAQGALVNHTRLINSGMLSLGHVGASLVNRGRWENRGTIKAQVGLIDNVAGRFLNAQGANIEVAEVLRNHSGARLMNAGLISLGMTGHIDNARGATLLNSGHVDGSWDAKLANAGTLINQSGGVFSPAVIHNTGRITNQAGATMAQRVFHNAAGSFIANQGVINNDRDGLFTLAAGSNYDFTGGTFKNGYLSQLALERDFTFGEAKAGTVVLESNASVRNTAHVRVAAGYTQTSAGGFSNKGQFTIQGGFLNQDYFFNAQGARLTNAASGRFDTSGHVLNAGIVANHGRLTLAHGDWVNEAGAVFGNAGEIVFGMGRLVNRGLVENTGKMTLESRSYEGLGGTLRNGRGGVLTFESALTFGAPASGSLVLGQGGRLNALGRLTNKAGHTQVNAGEIQVAYAPLTNEKGATFVNDGAVTLAGTFTQAGTWKGKGSLEQVEGRAIFTGSTRQDTVKFVLGSATLQDGASLTAREISFGLGSVKLNGGTITSPNQILSAVMSVEGQGGRVRGSLYNEERLRVEGAPLVVTETLTLNGRFEQRGADTRTQVGDLVVGSRGSMEAVGDVVVRHDFINGSQAGALWNTTGASLQLLGTGRQELALAGEDLGADGAGLAASNFSWGEVVFGGRGSWTLTDGNGEPGAALYARTLTFLGGLDDLAHLSGNFNIYYDKHAVGNAILGGLDYDFGQGSGRVIAMDLSAPVPEPATWALVLAGAFVIAQRRTPRRSAS